jgi:DNA/RNA-binding domain of Phe-tRNA-synthetase-like protein
MKISVQPVLEGRFPGLKALICSVEGVRVKERDENLELFKQTVIEETKRSYEVSTLKDVAIFRAYRDFFWRAGIDPTKVRPAAEALIRRIIAGKPIPTVNTLVDSYNLASVRTCVAMGAFDVEKLRGNLLLRSAKVGEKFLGIGMSEPIELEGNELVVSDDEKLIAVYPYRDAEETKVTLNTKSVRLLICGAPGIGEDVLREASGVAVEYVTKFCGGAGRFEP